MFQFPWFPSSELCVRSAIRGHAPTWVSPFGYLGLTGCTHLHRAFRSVPRPSSALNAKAFSVRPCSFFLARVAENSFFSHALRFTYYFSRLANVSYSVGNVRRGYSPRTTHKFPCAFCAMNNATTATVNFTAAWFAHSSCKVHSRPETKTTRHSSGRELHDTLIMSVISI
jgi:hypothetical protein